MVIIMKKILFLIVLFLLWLSVSFADSIWDVSVSFCNTWSDSRSLNFAILAGSPYEFCVEFSNLSQEKISLSIWFVDGELTNDELQNKACSYEWSDFWPYVNFSKKNLTLFSWSTIQITGDLMFPLGYSWEVHWCLVYSIPNKINSIEQWGSLFDVVIRKANFIDGYVAWEFLRSIVLLSWEVSYYRDKVDNDLVVSLPFVISWIIPEFLQFTWILNNILGYERSVVSSKILSGNSSIIFRFSDIPFYQGKYNFSFEWSSLLDTRLDLSYLPDDSKKILFFFYEKNLFLIPWMLVFEIIWFFVALFVLRLILKIILRR